MKVEFIRVLTPEEVSIIQSNVKKEVNKEDLEQVIGTKNIIGVGDTGVMIKNPIINGLYKYNHKSKQTYYVVTSILEQELALCYSIY